MSRGLFIGLFVLANQYLPIAFGQGNPAQCILGTFQWSFNSHKQSPCMVASSLLGVCSPEYQLNSVVPGQHYDGPSVDSQNPCQCSTVSYSLVSACAGCQNATITQWSEWSANCGNVSISSFVKPIPSGIFVPGWAYLDVKKGDMFNITLAKLNINQTESVAIPSPTSSNPATPFPSKDVTGGVSSQPSDPVLSSSQANRIMGAIIGVTFGFAALSLLLLYRHLERNAKPAQLAEDIPQVSPTASNSPSTAEMEKKLPPTLVVHSPVLPSPITAKT